MAPNRRALVPHAVLFYYDILLYQQRLASETDWHHQRQEWLKSEVLKREELKVTRFKTASEVAELIKTVTLVNCYT